MYASLPKTTEAEVLGSQVLRSGTSVGAGYREASRGRSKTEFVARVGECLKDLDETGYWLELLVEAEILPENRLSGLLRESSELTAIFLAITNKTKKNQDWK